MTRLVLLIGVVAAGAATLGIAAAQGPGTVPPDAKQSLAFFESRIRPLLVAECYPCHSAASKPIMGGLRLDSKQGMLSGGSHGPALIAGDPGKSLIVKAVRYSGDADLKMPPKGKLSDPQIADIVAWIRMGAPDPRDVSGSSKQRGLSVLEGKRHWAFQPLRLPQPVSPKTAAERSWRRNRIDDYVLDKLRGKQLTPSSMADRRTLIRRAYLDVIGLPPTPEEVAHFIADKSPAAWERVVDQLLASPHYGERWGRHWLDLARFAESHGYEQDYDRPNAYHYRDFVIKALNEDIPYTKFVEWQIAGDELEPENPMALMATGFLAAGTHATQITKNQVEKERYDELDDMLSTTFTSMLGLTIGCARCHDHKFDPMPQRDYYRLLSTFTTTVRSDYEVNMDPAGFRKKRAEFELKHAPIVKSLIDFERDQLPGRLKQRIRDKSSLPRADWYFVNMDEAKSSGGAVLTKQADGSYLASGKNPDSDTYTFVLKTALSSVTALRIEALSDPSLVKGGPGRAGNGNFDLTNVRVTAAPASDPTKTTAVKLVRPRAGFEQKGLPIAAAIDGDAKSGWAVDPEFGKDHVAAFAFEDPIAYKGGSIVTVTLSFEGNGGHNIGRPRLALASSRQDVGLNFASRPEQIENILARLSSTPDPVSDTELTVLTQWFKSEDAEWIALNRRVQESLAFEPKPANQKVLISSEGVPAIRTHTQGGDYLEQTHFLNRGDPNQKADVVTQSFLQVMMPSADSASRWILPAPDGWRTSFRRVSLAKWMTDMNDGAGALLARVIVNRLWQHYMGVGIVATPSDFGVIGERPTHPELLDWLAAELTRGGWKMKSSHRLILTSATYMQRSVADKAKTKIDPDNRLHWRHQRKRMEAETIRDAMLSVSGRLEPTLYGPGTLDEKMTRRSIYFFIKRSRLIPSMMVFDAPNALLGIPQRATTTVAPQALMMMNNAEVRACASALARRAMDRERSVAADTSDANALLSAIGRAYQFALGRPPSQVETRESADFISAQAKAYQVAGSATAQSAAFTDFCQALLSLNEFVYVE